MLLRIAVLLLIILSGCNAATSREDPDATQISGEDVYRLRVDGGNTFTCATCHALAEPAADGLRRPGHALGGAPARATYKNGQVADFRDAVNSCLTEWMGAQAWSASDRRLGALTDFLLDQENVGPVSFEIVPPPADATGGDAVAGQALFNASCVVCHGINAPGTNKAPGLLGLGLETDYITRRIRTSGLPSSSVYDGLTGGRMPFWAADRLTDDELRHLAAFVASAEPAEEEPEEEETPEETGRTCGQTHAKIGQSLDFSNRFHGVSGTAEVVDDCTIVVRNFNYDGAGIDVQIYAALGTNFSSGFSISPDLVKRGGYEGETLTLTLPEGRSLDELDSLSVWCVAVGVDFGSGTFN